MPQVIVNKWNLPVFTIAALALLILKYTAFPTISWWLVLGVWCFPCILTLSIVILGLLFAVAALALCGIVVCCAAVIDFFK